MRVRSTALVAGQAILTAGLLFGSATLLLLSTPARPHPATNVQGQPLGITYPSGCCNSAATVPNGDCAPIDDRFVTERADGYHVDLPPGSHPKLKKKGYKAVIPYNDKGIKQPISEDFHLCVATDGSYRYCFFPKPGAV